MSVAVAGARASVTARASAIRDEHYEKLAVRIDRFFVALLVGQWILAVVLASVVAPAVWDGTTSRTHPHVWFALGLGGMLAVPPALLARVWPGAPATRYTIAVAQMAFGALLIHVTGGRIETHFHVFGSLAFIAFYRDARALLLATAFTVADHVARGVIWPESIFGVAAMQPLRWLEHTAWVAFEDVFLLAALANERRVVGRKQLELETLNATLESRVEERTRELTSSREQYRMLVESTQAVPWEMASGDLSFTYVGPQASALLGYPTSELVSEGALARALHPEERAETIAWLEGLSADEAEGEHEARLRTSEGRWVSLRWFASVTQDATGRAVRRGIFLDVTARHALEAELRSAQRLESVGRLAAGVAHEINTPVQFVSDNVQFVTDGVRSLVTTVRTMSRLMDATAEDLPALVSDAREACEEADVEYLLENLPDALVSSVEGLDRIAAIVRALKEFSHPDRTEKRRVDLNANVRTTLTMTANEYRQIADVVTELGDLPAISCHAGEINQVLLNLIVNASHAIADAVRGTTRRGTITVRTWRDGDSVSVSVGDTGAGIPIGVRSKIFDPFFTTKEVGKGTGQGLAIARTIVVDKHGGELTFESELGCGTAFVVRLPLGQNDSEVAA